MFKFVPFLSVIAVLIHVALCGSTYYVDIELEALNAVGLQRYFKGMYLVQYCVHPYHSNRVDKMQALSKPYRINDQYATYKMKTASCYEDGTVKAFRIGFGKNMHLRSSKQRLVKCPKMDIRPSHHRKPVDGNRNMSQVDIEVLLSKEELVLCRYATDHSLIKLNIENRPNSALFN